MKRSRENSAPSTEEAAPRDASKGGLLKECWADLRGRPRPVAEPDWMEEEAPRSDSGRYGIGVSQEEIERLQRRYSTTTN